MKTTVKRRLAALLLALLMLLSAGISASAEERETPDTYPEETVPEETAPEENAEEEPDGEPDGNGSDEPGGEAPGENDQVGEDPGDKPGEEDSGEEDTEEEEPEDKDFLCDEVGELLITEAHGAYMSGDANGAIRPDKPIIRAEAAELFCRLLREKPEPENAFTDVPEGAWYAPAVNALAALGALSGYGDGTFRPGNRITRAEFIALATQFAAPEEGKSSFSDVSEEHWARAYIDTAVAREWIKGYPDGTFRPEEPITRAEAVTVINAMLGRAPEPEIREMVLPVQFPDLPREHWAFPQLCEAIVAHDYKTEGGAERWTDPSHEVLGGWIMTEGRWHYRDYYTGRFWTGFQPIDGYTYYFDPQTGAIVTGWQVIGGKNYLLPTRDQADFAPEVSELLTQVNYNEASRTAADIKYITMHYTAQPGDTAKGECQAFRTVYRSASAHYFVDETGIWRCVKDKDISWHCGSYVYHHDECRNANSIGIEMCCRKRDMSHVTSAYDPDWYFMPGTEENAAVLVREMMMKYGVPLENVVRHNDVSHKTCPAPYVNDFSAWRNFLQSVSEYRTEYDGRYRAAVIGEVLNVRTGPGVMYPVLGQLKKGDQITVLSEYGNDGMAGKRWARTAGGWVSYDYICRLKS